MLFKRDIHVTSHIHIEKLRNIDLSLNQKHVEDADPSPSSGPSHSSYHGTASPD